MRFTWVSQPLTYETRLVNKHGAQFYALVNNIGLFTLDANAVCYLALSTNLVDWTYHVLPAGLGLDGDVAYNGTIYVASSRNGEHKVYSSPTGVTWTQRTLPSVPVVGGNGASAYVVWNAGRSEFLLLLSNGTYTANSPDGITWSNFSSDLPNTFNETPKVVGGLYTMVQPGAPYPLFTSTDGATWTSALTDIGNTTSVAGRLWTSGGSFLKRVSSDGLSWTAVTDIGQDQYAQSVVNNTVVCLAGFAHFLSSGDGLNWARGTNFPGFTMYSNNAWWHGDQLFLFNASTLYVGTPNPFWAGHRFTQEVD